MDTQQDFQGVSEPSRATFLCRGRQLCHAGPHLWDQEALDKSAVWQKPCLDPEKGQQRWKAQWSHGPESWSDSRAPCAGAVPSGVELCGLMPSLVMMCPCKLGTFPECQAASETAAGGVPGWNALSVKCGEFYMFKDEFIWPFILLLDLIYIKETLKKNHPEKWYFTAVFGFTPVKCRDCCMYWQIAVLE